MVSFPIGFIADMYGPHFLVFFGCVSVAVLVTCWCLIRSRDKTGDLPPLPVPDSPNAYDVAFLRGGENEVARVLLLDLIQRGYLDAVEEKSGLFSKEQKLVRKANHPDSRHLSAIGRDVLSHFSTPRSAREIFQSSSIPDLVKGSCAETEARLRDDELLSSDEMRTAAVPIGLVGGAIILCLGGFKLLAALAAGHTNVLFLLIMGAIALGILIKVCIPPRLSLRGQRHLEMLEQRFSQLKHHTNPVSSAGPDPLLVLSVAIFGVTALEGTSYGYFHEMFQRSASGGWCGGCGGGGCGGGGCGGGGCGGGCGGCGGG